LEWEIPKSISGGRFGQIAYKNPVAREKSFQATDESRLLELIDEALFGRLGNFKNKSWWEGRGRDLETELRSDQETWRECVQMGARGKQMGVMLHALARNPGTQKRFRITNRRNRSWYKIFSPPPQTPPPTKPPP
jgi:hypothetical protein